MENAGGPIALAIRAEKEKDAAAVRTVVSCAFGRRDEADLVDALRMSCPDRVSLVAEVNGKPVAHILFTPVVLDAAARCLEGMGLAPVAVLPEFQGRGIGSRLIKMGLEKLRNDGRSFVVVLGEPAYYSRFGFQAASHFGIACEFEGVPEDALMILAFDEQAVDGASGVARYRPEFREFA